MSILCLVMHVLCVYAVKLLSGFFGTRSGFFGENRLATLQSSRLHRMRKWCRLTCLQEFIETATRWVYGWSRLVTGQKEAEVAEAKPPQNLPLHSKTALNPYKFQQQKPNQ